MISPGYKTTEFWLTVLVTVCGAIMASGALPEGSLVGQIIGGVMVILGQLGYTAARAQVKAIQPPELK